MPAYGFGSSSREKEGQRFMSSTHAKTLRGSFSPPNYNHQVPENTTGFGKQKLSRNETVPAYGFGSQPRLQFKTSTTPVSRPSKTWHASLLRCLLAPCAKWLRHTC